MAEVGDVVIANFLHSRDAGFRPRPAVVLGHAGTQVVLCGLTTARKYADGTPRKPIRVLALNERPASYLWSTRAMRVGADSIDRTVGVCDPAAAAVIIDYLEPDHDWSPAALLAASGGSEGIPQERDHEHR